MKRGASRMREQGYKQVILWLSPNEYEQIHAAARIERKPMATWLRNNANDLAKLTVINDQAEQAKRRSRPLIEALLDDHQNGNHVRPAGKGP